jgi:hypothetical protein
LRVNYRQSLFGAVSIFLSFSNCVVIEIEPTVEFT